MATTDVGEIKKLLKKMSRGGTVNVDILRETGLGKVRILWSLNFANMIGCMRISCFFLTISTIVRLLLPFLLFSYCVTLHIHQDVKPLKKHADGELASLAQNLIKEWKEQCAV